MTSGRLRGSSLVRRLAVIIAIPLIAFTVFAVERIDEQRDAAGAARALADDVELQAAVAAVYGPMQIEHIALEGLAAIDAQGVPREIVVAFTGVDFAQLSDEYSARLDGVLARLDLDHGELSVRGAPLSEHVATIETDLAELRTRSADRVATNDEVGRFFTGAFALLDELVGIATSGADGSADVEERAQLIALSNIHDCASARGDAINRLMTDAGPETFAELTDVTAKLDAALAVYDVLVDDPAFDAVSAALRPVPESLLLPVEAGADAQLQPDYIAGATNAVLEHVEFLETLERYSLEVNAAAVAELDTVAADAERRVVVIWLAVAMIALVSAGLALALGVPMLRALRRLSRRAGEIGGGDLSPDPLPVRGPGDVRALTVSVNHMLSTLAGVDQELRRLSGASDDTAPAELPGVIGINVRQSFDRLAEVTSRLASSEQRAAAIVEHAADAIFTLDGEGRIVSVNEAGASLLDRPSEAVAGEPLLDFLSALDGEAVVSGRPGPVRVLVSSSTTEFGREPLTTVIAHDVSERLRFEEQLAYQAQHDALTGLPNRFAVLERLASSDPERSVAVLFVDLDGFKMVNDTQGHLVGDGVLAEVGRRLSGRLRPDDFVGRLGGDEFVVVLDDFPGVDGVVEFGRRMIHEIEQPYEGHEGVFSLSASVGVAVYEPGVVGRRLSALEVIEHADSAVYSAKSRGRGRVEVFDEELRRRVRRDAEIAQGLRLALPREELLTHIQPIYDPHARRFVGGEMLVRWHRPGVGMVPPAEFIPVAERSSLIFDLERFVMRSACETLARWQTLEPGCPLRLAVNVSGRHLVDGDLLADLRAIITETGVAADRLDIELTESQVVGDLCRAADLLEEIRTLGVRVAIDDFGTGYSSMAYLRGLPVDALKIDRSFVADVLTDRTGRAVVDAIVRVGRTVGLDVIGEGVESHEQLVALTDLGCDLVQGFHLARPLPVDEAEGVLGAPRLASPRRV